MIILHATAGSFAGAVTWLTNSRSKVSSHYVVSKKGDCYQIVQDHDIAWHAGDSSWKGQKNINAISIGIEIENNNKGEAYPEKQIAVVAQLVAFLMRRYSVPIDRVLSHAQIAPKRKTDPYKFPWTSFKKQVADILI